MENAAPPPTSDDMPALGEEFRSAREARGLSLSEVSEQIHIRSVYLNAIENEDWPSIGAPVYVRGFLRTYARFLAVDAEAAVERFNRTVPAERHPSAAAASSAGVGSVERDRPAVSPWAVIAVLVAAVLVGFVGFEWWTYAHGGSGSAVATAPQSAVTGPPSAATPAGVAGADSDVSPSPAASGALASSSPPPALQHELAIRLTARSWLRVTVDGKTQTRRDLSGGHRRARSTERSPTSARATPAA